MCNHRRPRWLYHLHPPPKRITMKLSKALLSAILVGATVQTITSCGKKDAPKPTAENNQNGKKEPLNCPGCGLG